jgi:L-asparaginase II
MSMPVLAEVVRSGFVEGHHRGSLVALGADGAALEEAGDVRSAMLPRSCNKPLQAVGMVRAGLDLPPDLLALGCASHSGEPFHVEGVRRILRGAGLAEDALQTPPDYPLDDEERDRLLRSGGDRAPVLMNCSGKHAGMLATCVVNGWPTSTYLDPDHPLQRAIRDTFVELTGEPVAHVAVDGCGAPLLSTSLTGLARAFARLATATDGAEHRVGQAIRAHPPVVSGTRRDEAALLVAMPGAIAKAGAEGCYALALPDGRAAACKIDDGGVRARPVVMAALLHRLGWDADPGVDAQAVARTGQSPLLGGPRQVGEIRPVAPASTG